MVPAWYPASSTGARRAGPSADRIQVSVKRIPLLAQQSKVGVDARDHRRGHFGGRRLRIHEPDVTQAEPPALGSADDGNVWCLQSLACKDLDFPRIRNARQGVRHSLRPNDMSGMCMVQDRSFCAGCSERGDTAPPYAIPRIRSHPHTAGWLMATPVEPMSSARVGRCPDRLRVVARGRRQRGDGSGTGTTSSPSIPVKSSGLHVYTGRACASAVAAIMAS